MLPEVKPSSGLLGETDPKWFGAAIPIAGCAGDQQLAWLARCLAQWLTKQLTQQLVWIPRHLGPAVALGGACEQRTRWWRSAAG